MAGARRARLDAREARQEARAPVGERAVDLRVRPAAQRRRSPRTRPRRRAAASPRGLVRPSTPAAPRPRARPARATRRAPRRRAGRPPAARPTPRGSAGATRWRAARSRIASCLQTVRSHAPAVACVDAVDALQVDLERALVGVRGVVVAQRVAPREPQQRGGVRRAPPRSRGRPRRDRHIPLDGTRAARRTPCRSRRRPRRRRAAPRAGSCPRQARRTLRRIDAPAVVAHLHATEPREQRQHRAVGRQQRGRELRHADLARARRQPVQQHAAEPAPLPVVGDRDRRLGDRAARPLAHEPRDADPRPGLRIERADRLVAVVVDVGEVRELATASAAAWAP